MHPGRRPPRGCGERAPVRRDGGAPRSADDPPNAQARRRPTGHPGLHRGHDTTAQRNSKSRHAASGPPAPAPSVTHTIDRWDIPHRCYLTRMRARSFVGPSRPTRARGISPAGSHGQASAVWPAPTLTAILDRQQEYVQSGVSLKDPSDDEPQRPVHQRVQQLLFPQWPRGSNLPL